MFTFMGLYSKIFAERIAEKEKKKPKNNTYLYVHGLLFMLISCITLHYKKEKPCCIYTQKGSNKHKKYGYLKWQQFLKSVI